MLGAIIGDIVGSRFEFDQTPQEGFTLFTGECGYTDDTVCTVAVADALLNHKPYKESLLEWCRRYPFPKGGYGRMFLRWLMEADPLPQSSFGNGAAMRVSSVGWLIHDYKEVLRQAEQTALVSHCHPEGIRGAQCIAGMIYLLRTCRIAKNEVELAAKKRFGYDLPTLDYIYKVGESGHFDVTCQETVPYALRCLIESNSFETAIRLAVMARGDTDTKAAICGSMTEALYTVPEDMMSKALEYLPDEMINIVEQFYDAVKENVKSQG